MALLSTSKTLKDIMATKLYKYTSDKPLVHPSLYPGGEENRIILWHNLGDRTFISCSTAVKAVFAEKNEAGAFKVASAAEADEIKVHLSSRFKRKKREAIAQEFSLTDELMAIRKKDSSVADRITEIIAGYDVERDNLVKIS